MQSVIHNELSKGMRWKMTTGNHIQQGRAGLPRGGGLTVGEAKMWTAVASPCECAVPVTHGPSQESQLEARDQLERHSREIFGDA